MYLLLSTVTRGGASGANATGAKLLWGRKNVRKVQANGAPHYARTKIDLSIGME